MQKEVVILAVLGCVATNTARATYTIDGNLSDWGVTPFSQWVPNAPASYTVTDNINLYNVAGYSEAYDYEAMYFADDAANFYFGVVSSQPLGPGTAGGDLGFDLNGDMAISTHGVVTGLEYALHVASGNPGQVVYNPIWTDTGIYLWSDGWQGSPYVAHGGTSVGFGTIAVGYDPTLESGSGAYILEAAVPRSILPGFGGDAGDVIGIHMTDFCGNDSINLFPVLSKGPTPGGEGTPSVPVPGAVVLGGLGVGLVGWLRRSRVFA